MKEVVLSSGGYEGSVFPFKDFMEPQQKILMELSRKSFHHLYWLTFSELNDTKKHCATFGCQVDVIMLLIIISYELVQTLRKETELGSQKFCEIQTACYK